MPKLGMENLRKNALIKATIFEVGKAGSLDVTVAQIAKRAGVSGALAHHYFGSKDHLFLASMRHIMSSFGARLRTELAEAHTPKDRLNAIIAASFDPENFEPEVISAWLTFYVRSQVSPQSKRLFTIYVRRLQSNLVFSLRLITSPANARLIAHTVGALIDGLYIRQALQADPMDRFQTMGIVWDYLDLKLNQWKD